MGWLDAMEELHSDLRRGTNKSVDVKIGMLNNYFTFISLFFSFLYGEFVLMHT